MFFRFLILIGVILSVTSCGINKKLEKVITGESQIGLSLPNTHEIGVDTEEKITVDSTSTDNSEPLIMNAIKDSKTGEMVAVDVISASKVVARFRNVAERFGKIELEFDIIIPREMLDSQWQLKFYPKIKYLNDSLSIKPLFITGEKYRSLQLLGYKRYEAFLSTIIKDSTEFIRIEQLEKFIERNFKHIYIMKTDSTFISNEEAENIFGVNQKDAIKHYTKRWLISINNKRINKTEKMYHRYVKDPILKDVIELDSLIVDDENGLIYRYHYLAQSLPNLKKIVLSLNGKLYEDGVCISEIKQPEDITYYISSLSTLVDKTPRYIRKIVERRLYDNTFAFIDFKTSSYKIDPNLSDNAFELERIKESVRGIDNKSDYILDSIRVSSSCSPEGAYSYNQKLSQARSTAVSDYLKEQFGNLEKKVVTASIPENWDKLRLLIKNDSLISDKTKSKLLVPIKKQDLDDFEASFVHLPEYRYLREDIYPKLRAVNFEFFLHKAGVIKDTVHTTTIDSVYMSGVEALINLDYKKAVTKLLPYEDYNSALACLAAGYEETALDILEKLPKQNAHSLYLLSIIYARNEKYIIAKTYFEKAVKLEPTLKYRANLDPELADII